MTKEHILAEIRRTAVANDGVPLGQARFCAQTGIRYTDWHGKYWARFGDAVREAGFQANRMNAPYPDSELLEKLATLVRDLGRFPVAGELRLRARTDPSFPSHNVFHRLGSKATIAAKLLNHSLEHGYDDVAAICSPLTASPVLRLMWMKIGQVRGRFNSAPCIFSSPASVTRSAGPTRLADVSASLPFKFLSALS